MSQFVALLVLNGVLSKKWKHSFNMNFILFVKVRVVRVDQKMKVNRIPMQVGPP